MKFDSKENAVVREIKMTDDELRIRLTDGTLVAWRFSSLIGAQPKTLVKAFEGMTDMLKDRYREEDK